MTASLTILGCGSSAGVPRIGGNWGQCDPSNPKNRRKRCSVLVRSTSQTGETRVLIDTSPDMREQMLGAEIGWIDAAIYTHEHADHTHGIDELRAFFINQRKRVPIWADDRTASMLTTRFGYCFYSPPGSDYPPIASMNRIMPHETITVSGAGGAVTALPFEVEHGNIKALGFRFNRTAYTPDINGIPEPAMGVLEGLDLWIVDALRRDPHQSHFSLPETLDWIERLKPRRAIITNMHIDLDFDTLARELPTHVEPAYDGLTVAI